MHAPQHVKRSTIMKTYLLQKINVDHLATFFVVVLFFFPLLFAHAATLTLTPASGSYGVGQTFTTSLRAVPSSGEQVNAVEATLKFNPSLLSVVSVSKSGSVFSLWTTEPTFSNTAGTLTLGGGSSSSFISTSHIVSVTFRTLAQGSASVSFSGGSVLVADGRATDVYKGGSSATFSITSAITAATPTPEIGSPTFFDPNIWYRETEGVFTWTLPFNVDVVAVEVSSDPQNKPQENNDAIEDPAVEEFFVSKDTIKDGVQYISVNYKNQFGWGIPINRKLQIDTTTPEPFTVNVQAGSSSDSFPLLNFEAADVTSGIDSYEMTIADQLPIKISPEEAKIGYLLRDLENGTYTIKVVAFDKAGNTREGSVTVPITAGWTRSAEGVDQGLFWNFFTAVNLFIIFLLTIVGLMGTYLWNNHKRMHEREEKLRRETKEIQDQMEKIFSALRDEIYDQILSITARKRLTPKEKEAIEGLTQALEVSETLIGKEINDVKAILK